MRSGSNGDAVGVILIVIAAFIGLGIWKASKVLGVDFATAMKFIVSTAIALSALVVYLWQDTLRTKWSIPFFVSTLVICFIPILDRWAAGPEFMNFGPEHWYGLWYWQAALVLFPWVLFYIFTVIFED